MYFIINVFIYESSILLVVNQPVTMLVRLANEQFFCTSCQENHLTAWMNWTVITSLTN